MYQKGDKFVVEIGEVLENKSGKTLYKMKGFRTLVFDEYGLEQLCPANHNENSFRRGYNMALDEIEKGLPCKKFIEGETDAEECLPWNEKKSAYEKGYQNGWDNALKAVSTVVMPERKNE